MRFGIFHQKQLFFHEMMVSPCRVMNSIACYSGIWIDQWMLGIGELWYFSSKTVVFSRNDGFTMLCDEHHCLLLWYLIDQCMLGIGEVWYFPSKKAVFSRNDGSTMMCDEQHDVLWWYLD